MEYLIGVVVAVMVCVFGLLSGFDRERAFYSTIVIVVASYYILFAVLAGSMPALAAESAVACAFVALAVAGFKTSPWWLVAGLVGHGVFDSFHAWVIHNPGLPARWPGFCLSFDILAGIFLAALLLRRPASAPPR
jgi:hypothetical protein